MMIMMLIAMKANFTLAVTIISSNRFLSAYQYFYELRIDFLYRITTRKLSDDTSLVSQFYVDILS